MPEEGTGGDCSQGFSKRKKKGEKKKRTCKLKTKFCLLETWKWQPGHGYARFFGNLVEIWCVGGKRQQMLENLFLKFRQGLLNKDINLKILLLPVLCGFVISGDGWLVVIERVSPFADVSFYFKFLWPQVQLVM